MARIPLVPLLLAFAGLLLEPSALAQTPAPPAKASSEKGAPAKTTQAKAKSAPVKGSAAAAKGPVGRPKKAAVAVLRNVLRKDGAEPAPPARGPIVTAPGFRMIDEGKSRVFLEVSQKVEITERRAAGSVIYQLKGASVPLRNSRLPLPTGFFPTPVGRVELVHQGDSADLVIELREPATPSYQVIETPRGIALQVDFPPPRGARGTDPSFRRSSKQLAPDNGPTE